jgi:hypothetical protein
MRLSAGKPLRQAMASEGCRRLAALMAGTKATISGGKRASGGQIRQITPPGTAYHRIPPLDNFFVL